MEHFANVKAIFPETKKIPFRWSFAAPGPAVAWNKCGIRRLGTSKGATMRVHGVSFIH
jgi:hypothetical protein